jgi:hypothetical protein
MFRRNHRLGATAALFAAVRCAHLQEKVT